MNKGPTKEDWPKRNTRYPPDVLVELTEAAARNDRSFNAEVIARVRIDDVALLRQEVAELKSLVREVLDHVRK